MSSVRQPVVAGAFYPADPARLSDLVDRLLANTDVGKGLPLPRALVVPHAGYMYSGPIAASAFARLRNTAERLRRVMIIGPSHYVPFRGLALPDADAMATPLGTMQIDAEGVKVATQFSQVTSFSLPHVQEHSLEVMLPFLQLILPGILLVPLATGTADPEQVAEVIDALWNDDTLILVSTDLSHYHSYDEARTIDSVTAQRIVELDAKLISQDAACGAVGLNGLIVAARQRKLSVRQLDLRNSGDTAGDRQRVVGYGAFSFEDS